MDDRGDLEAWLRRHDEAAFARVIARHAAMVAGLCRRRLGLGDEADDAAQAVFVILARRCAEIRDPDRLGPWLYGTALRVCANARRSAAVRSHHTGEVAMRIRTDHPSQADDLPFEDLRPHLDTAIATLAPAQRDALIAHYLEGLPQSVVALRLGISEDAAKKRIHYAIDKLRRWFAGRGLPVTASTLAVGLAAEAGAIEPQLLQRCITAGTGGGASPTVQALAETGSRSMAGTIALCAGAGAGVAAVLVWMLAATATAPVPGPLPAPVPAPVVAADPDPLAQTVAVSGENLDVDAAMAAIVGATPPGRRRLLWTMPDGLQYHWGHYLGDGPRVDLDGTARPVRAWLDLLATASRTSWRLAPAVVAWSSGTVVFEVTDRVITSLPTPFTPGQAPWCASQVAQGLATGAFPATWDPAEGAVAARRGRRGLPFTVAAAEDPRVQQAVLQHMQVEGIFYRQWGAHTAGILRLAPALPLLQVRNDRDALVALACFGRPEDAHAWIAELATAEPERKIDLLAALAEHPERIAIDALLRHLADQRTDVRSAAARSLVGRATEADLDRVAAALAAEQEPTAALALAMTLADAGRKVDRAIAQRWLASAIIEELGTWLRLAADAAQDSLTVDLPLLERAADRTLPLGADPLTAPWPVIGAWFASTVPCMPERAGAEVPLSPPDRGARLALAVLAGLARPQGGVLLTQAWERHRQEPIHRWVLAAMLASRHRATRLAGVAIAAADPALGDALMLLKDTQDQATMAALAAVALGDGPVAARARALSILTGPFDAATLARLNRLAAEDPHPWIRAMALDRLAGDRLHRRSIGFDGQRSPAGIPPELDPGLVHRTLDSEHAFERWYALKALAETAASPATADDRRRMLATDPHPSVRHYALTQTYQADADADRLAIAQALAGATDGARIDIVRMVADRLFDPQRPATGAVRAEMLRALETTRDPELQADIAHILGAARGEHPFAPEPTRLSLEASLRPHVIWTRLEGRRPAIGTSDAIPEWSPADYGETSPDLFPAPPQGRG